MAVLTQGAPTADQKKPRHRSPNYPAENLEAAVRRVQKLWDQDREAGSTVETAASHMGFNKAHGDAMSVLAGLKKFGLVEMRNDRVYVTKRAINILLFPESERGQAALKEAVLLPQIYRELFNRFKGTGLPSDKTLRAELIADSGFNPKAVDTFLKDFRKSLEYAGISPETALNSSVSEQSPENLDESQDEELQLKPEDEGAGVFAETPAKPLKSKVFNVALDPITSAAPQFGQVLIPIPLRDDQKKRLLAFIENL